ncbi:hypothetical protein ABLU29_13130 [Lactococcus lactis]|uniref:hypothetical protein n=1 Tax=Lactococcus lactis TaxID=1358 RepID=UPI003877FF36
MAFKKSDSPKVTRARLLVFLGMIAAATILLIFGISKLESLSIVHSYLGYVNLIVHYLKVILICVITVFVGIVILTIGQLIYTKRSGSPYYYILHHRLDNWLQMVGVCRVDTEGNTLIPRVRKIKIGTKDGLEIEIIGDSRRDLLEIQDALTDYVQSKGSPWTVSDCYPFNGYVIYVFDKGIEDDRLSGGDIGL